MKTTTDLQDKMFEELAYGMCGETVARAFLNYYGVQLLSEGFAEFLIDEGYCDAEDLGLEDDDEDDEDEY